MGLVKHAILVAGGLGTRMLPASGAVAKEMLPLFDIPAMTHLALEAVQAGVENIHIITSPKKDFSNYLEDKTWLIEKRPDIKNELLNPFSEIKVFKRTYSNVTGSNPTQHSTWKRFFSLNKVITFNY